MSTPDPWAILGLAPGSTLAQARTARKQLAKRYHPDVHQGDAARMTLVNRALADIEQRLEAGKVPPISGPGAAGRQSPGPGRAGAGRGAGGHGGHDHPRPAAEALDPESFSVASLPAEAFEALFLVSYGLGDILVADEPYLLELYLTEPAPCFCQLTLVPEAGGSIVTLDVGPPAEAEAPTTESVRDMLVSELNRLAVH